MTFTTPITLHGLQLEARHLDAREDTIVLVLGPFPGGWWSALTVYRDRQGPLSCVAFIPSGHPTDGITAWTKPLQLHVGRA